MAKKDRVELGDAVRDPVTGFAGVVISMTTHLTGCDQAGVQAPLNKKDGKYGDYYSFDVNRLVVTKKGKIPPESVQAPADPGGPKPTPRRAR
jgi:hypothetical protein